MPQIPGPITNRLVAEFPPTDAGWSPCRSLKPATRSAAVGYRVGARRRSGRRTFWLGFAFDLLPIVAPSWALMLLLGLTQAASLGYLP